MRKLLDSERCIVGGVTADCAYNAGVEGERKELQLHVQDVQAEEVSGSVR